MALSNAPVSSRGRFLPAVGTSRLSGQGALRDCRDTWGLQKDYITRFPVQAYVGIISEYTHIEAFLKVPGI